MADTVSTTLGVADSLSMASVRADDLPSTPEFENLRRLIHEALEAARQLEAHEMGGTR